MKKLIDGVKKFQGEGYPSHEELFQNLAKGQQPETLFITCSDSRIDPNLLTQTVPGELFILRTAGNIVPPWDVGSASGEAATIEYAVNALGIGHVVICGHSHCGAMAGLLSPESTAALPAVTAYLQHASATREAVDRSYGDVEDPELRLARAVEQNVIAQLTNLQTHPSVAAAVDESRLQLHGWVYTFESGEVACLEPETGSFLPLADFDH